MPSTSSFVTPPFFPPTPAVSALLSAPLSPVPFTPAADPQHFFAHPLSLFRASALALPSDAQPPFAALSTSLLAASGAAAWHPHSPCQSQPTHCFAGAWGRTWRDAQHPF
eukprot:3810111-Rhodomonas_salina.1